jgi:hypothetical protein
MMASARVSVITKQDIAIAAKSFRWNRQLPKWTVMVDGRELPARPLVLEAARVPPNDPTNSHQAVKILQDRGFDVRYEGKPVRREEDRREEDRGEEDIEQPLQPISDDFIRSLRGCLKGEDSLVAARDREHRIEKDRTAR